MESGLLEGFTIGRSRTIVSHLQFANDTIFFSRAYLEELQTLKIILFKCLDIYMYLNSI